MSTLSDAGNAWNCPHCHLPLYNRSRSWVCTNNHSFDIAREGYVNLLLAHKKKSKAPGDSVETVTARRAFLTTELYRPIADRLCATVASIKERESGEVFRLLDCGCGDGYYANALQKTLNAETANAGQIFGLDISRAAVKSAAKRYPEIDFAIASAFRIPMNSKALHCVIQVFAPAKDQEIFRVLKSEGYYINVSPTKDHLIEIRERLYDEVKQRPTSPAKEDLFNLMSQSECRFTMRVGPDDSLSNLLRMTPHFWKAAYIKRQQLLESDVLDVTASVVLSIYKKR